MQQTSRKLGNAIPAQPSQMRKKFGPTFVNMGPSGAGKTTLLETLNDCPDYTPVCVLDVDGKAHVLTDRDDRDIYPCHTWKQLDDNVQELVKTRLHPQYKVVCFDGGTAIQQVLSYTKHQVRETTNPQLRQSAYGNSNLDLIDLAQSMRLLAESGIHVILNIWAASEVVEGTNMRMTMPDLTPTMLNRFLGLLDFVVYTDKGSMPNPYPPVMQWLGPANLGTRAAVSPDSPLYKMPEKIYRPSWADIFDAYHGQPFPVEKHQKG